AVPCAVAVVGLAAVAGALPAAALAALALCPLVFGLLSPGRDARDELEQQAAFEEAERRRAEARAAAVFEGFVDSSPVAIELFDVKGNPVKSNRAAERLLGKVPPPGLSLFSEAGLRRAGLLEPQLKRVLAGNRVETPPTWYDPTEIGLPGAPGRRVCFRATVFPLFEAEGNIGRIAVMHEDVTELKELEERCRTAVPAAAPATETSDPAPATDIRDLEFRRRKVEQALRESEERFRSFVERARGYAVVRRDENGKVLAASPAIEEIWGISANTIVADSSAWFAQVHPDDSERVRGVEAEARRRDSYPDDYRFRVNNLRTGKVHWVEVRGTVNPALGRRSFDAVVLDVTRLVEVEALLADRDAALAGLCASPVEAIIRLNSELMVTSWSPGAEPVTGFSADHAVGKPITGLYPDFEAAGFLPALKRARVEDRPQIHEAFYQDGREQHAGWFQIAFYPLPTGVILLVRNVSDRHRAELALREAELRLSGLLSSPGLAVSLKDTALKYLLVNPAAQQSLGASSEQSCLGRTDRDLLKKAVAELLSDHDKRVLDTGEPARLELALPDAISKAAAWYRMDKSLLRRADNSPAAILTVATDISRQVLAQQELARRRVFLEKLAAEQADVLKRVEDELGRWR
ncbi:PAS domain S-box protein, partial [candidate division WOR-3 bacterium]|nr:PAS domain S-box protein [candidate division WOR-3 bacterium]